jgi:hypothetical protein
MILTAVTPIVNDVAAIDWTAVIIASIAAFSAIFAAWQARLNSKQIRENSRMITTSNGKTIGEYVENLHLEMARIAEDKAVSDAALAAAALVAVARLAVATEPPPMSDQAEKEAVALVSDAKETAKLLRGKPWDGIDRRVGIDPNYTGPERRIKKSSPKKPQ